MSRQDIVRVARSYLGTPWHHLERQPGIGIDCAGLIICVMRELGLCAPDWDVEPYIQIPDGLSMIKQCDQYMTRIPIGAMQPGDAICIITDRHPQHLGILGDYLHGGLSLIHAANTAQPPRVIETRLMVSRVCRVVAAYSLPGVES